MPDSYRVSLTKRAVKEIGRIEPKARRLIRDRIAALATEPRPHDCRPLKTAPRSFRIDAGSYRIVYEIDDPSKTVTVWRALHRRDVYRNL